MISPRNNRVRAHVCSQNRSTVLYEESMVLRFLRRSSLIKRVLKFAAQFQVHALYSSVRILKEILPNALTFARFSYIFNFSKIS